MTAKQEVQRFVSFYDTELSRTGFKPDQNTSRDQRVQFLSNTLKRFCSKILVMKRASPSRPVSDEAVVSVLAGDQYRLFWDFIISGGSAAWRLSVDGDGEQLPTEQPLVNPLDLSTLTEPVGSAPTVPGCGGPEPGPGPTPQPQPQPVPVVPGREEALDEMDALDAYYKAPEGLQRPQGLSLDGRPDFLGIAAWYLDVYQQARVNGKSRAEARSAYVSDIRHSDEWRIKHPGETP